MRSAFVADESPRTYPNARSSSDAPTNALAANLLLTAPFLLLYLVQLVHHQMWRDEFNAFGIAVASPTLSSLFHHIHYEGHPWLWYMLLWFISKITVDPIGMKILEGVIGVSIYLVIGLSSPFSRLEKVLIFCGYFISFEYTVLSRMYGLLLLLLVAYLRLRSVESGSIEEKRRNILAGAALLGLMASTDTMGILLSGALVCEYGCYRFMNRSPAVAVPSRVTAWALLIYGALLGFAIWSAKPMPDVSWRTTGWPFAFAHSLAHLRESAVNYIVLPYLPARAFRDGFFWNPTGDIHPRLLSIALILIFAAYLYIFRSRPNLMVLVGTTILGCVLFGHLIYHGSMRHFGITFLAFFGGLWILRAKAPRLPVPAYLLLAMVAIGGVVAGAQQWRRPFSEAEATAAWIRANHLEAVPIAGTPDTTVASLAELLHRPVYMLDCKCSDTYLLFSNRRDQLVRSEIPARIVEARKALGVSPFLFIQDRRLEPASIAFLASNGLVARQIAAFVQAEVPEENFFIYKMSDVSSEP